MRGLNLPGALLLLCLGLCACAGKEPVASPPSVALAVDGPRLALLGEYAGMSLAGSMDRTCMVGYGSMHLEAVDSGATFVCTAKIDNPPTQRGRVRGVLRCTDGRELFFTLRNIGPDQGVGIGRESPEEGLLILFYHVSSDEAARRFPGVKADILAARAGGV
jgi:hypothetical protein